MKNISRLHYITQDIEGISHSELAEIACRGGANWIQLRAKNVPYEELLEIAEETKIICKKYGAKLIINDNVHIAKKIGADGVHLGKEDMDPLAARRILGDSFIIGGSANTVQDVISKREKKCDYIGLGPFRFTATKEKLSPVLGIDGLLEILLSPLIRQGEGYKIPVIAIGGIHLSDVQSLMNSGVYGVAVSSAINFSSDRINETKSFISALTPKKAANAHLI